MNGICCDVIVGCMGAIICLCSLSSFLISPIYLYIPLCLTVWTQSFVSGDNRHLPQPHIVGCMSSILYEWSISHISPSCLWMAVWAQSFMSGQYPTFNPTVYGWLYGLNPLWVVNIPHLSQLSMDGCMGSILYEWSISHISPSCL